MKHFYFLFIFLFSFAAQAQSQPYETERMIWNGIEYPYRYHHMEQYFNYYPEKRPVVNKDSTIINRNYIAFFEIKENKLYLNDLLISGKTKTKDYSVLKELNPKSEAMFLSWISGLFEFGTGLEQFQKNDSLVPYYNNYIVFEVNRGIIGRVEN
ncbi:MAG TPA: hypothetical protein VLY87_04650, partial [Flavobacterium sp.]|nr:hypothetical protein [Flavobacterium sp.]